VAERSTSFTVGLPICSRKHRLVLIARDGVLALRLGVFAFWRQNRAA
jgi:hypothetical protein